MTHRNILTGVYGPPLGIRYILFIDDINATMPDQYDVNSGVELLRHWIEFKQWYNLHDASVVQLIDLQVCSPNFSKNYSTNDSFCI